MCQTHSHTHEHGENNHNHPSGSHFEHQEGLINIPRLGEAAPDFNVRTTMGWRSLADYRGRWLVLFSYSGDFTPVSATELQAFAKYHDKIVALGADILAVSMDSINSHIAWVLSLHEKCGTTIPFPLAADNEGIFSYDYGLICESENAEQNARCLFIIDDNQKIRYASYYPAEVGRSAIEVLRVLAALKNFSENRQAAPADWKIGQAGIVASPQTVEEALATAQDDSYIDWYLSMKK